MSVRLVNLRLVALVLALGLGASQGRAQLASVSPFLPPQGSAPVGAPTPGAPLEFRGVMEDAGGLLFRIVDPARKTGAYVRLNERDPNLDFVVKQHEGSGDNETVVVEQSGRSFTLSLRTAKVVSSGAAGQGLMPPPPPPVNAPNVPPAVTNAVVLNPTPADEQRRLEAVAAEVARRRALREQATQQINQGVPVAPQVIQQPPPQPPPQQQQQGLPRASNANKAGPRGR